MYKGTTHVFSTDGPETEILITPGAGETLTINGQLSNESLDLYRGAGAYSILSGGSSGVVTLDTWNDFANTSVEPDEEMVDRTGVIGKSIIYTGTRNGVFAISYAVVLTGTALDQIKVGVSINDELKTITEMVTVGTDCSGMEAPIQALIGLEIDFKHVFSCELNKFARETIKANYCPLNMYEDITTRPNHYVDIYVCGFPCQPFSMSGKRLGTSDPRGTIFNSCYLFIEQNRPKAFILENVKGLLSIGEYWATIKNSLNSLTDYNVYHKVLNTKDYGIPQNRERIYIIGLRKDAQVKAFEFPGPVPPRPLISFVDASVTRRDPAPVRNPVVYETIINSKATFLNLGWQNFKTSSYEHYTPSIIAQASIWCVPMHRKATITELLTLQGFPKDFKQVVSNTQFKKQIGNAMSVNVLEYVLIEILKCIDFQFLSIPEKYNNSHLNLAK